MKKPAIPFYLILFLTLLGGIARGQYQTFLHNGMVRKYILHLPPVQLPGTPLVFLLHGYGGTAQSMISYTGMNTVADANHFAVCYPEGTKDEWGINCWNLRYDFQMGMTVNDVDFLDSLAVYLQNSYLFDPQKTFCAGHSNGADLCYRIACQDAGHFRAVASVSGCLMKWIHDSCTTVNPIPVFEIHGTEDPTTLWNGDPGNLQGYGPYYDVPFTFNFWDSVSNCQDEVIDTLPDVDPTDGSIVIRYKRINGADGNQVWLYKEEGAGHGWPGSGGTGTNMDFDASEEIWNFFQTTGTVTSLDNTGTGRNSVTIVPNPSGNFFRLTLRTFDHALPFALFDLYGRTVMTGTLNRKETVLDIRTHPPGIYFLKIPDADSNGIVVLKQ